nr:MAG TPA: hypothetical protein [Caudoviricetes sp.]
MSRAPSFAGRSIETKPINVENGSRYNQIDTGRIYYFEAENKIWYEMPILGKELIDKQRKDD